MKQYRIIRKNSYFGWQYVIQTKLFGLFWIRSLNQAFNTFDLDRVKEKVEDMQADCMRRNLRRKDEQNKVM